jgi:spore coat polysaccharide biosynthesis predicted glycosyltransferase SpsG
MNVAIWADGDAKIGMGHLIRQRTLSSALRERGHTIDFLSTTCNVTDDLLPNSVGVTSIHSPADAERFVREQSPDMLLLDLPVKSRSSSAMLLTKELQQRFRNLETQVCIFHGEDGGVVNCDIVINGHIYASHAKYQYLGQEPEWLLGTDYLIMDKEIRELANSELTVRDDPDRVVITIGGSDVKNSTPSVIPAFEDLDVSVEVIIGPGFTNQTRSSIREVAAETNATIEIVEDPPDLAWRLSRADLAVSALGLMAYELLALGTPFVGLTIAPDQEPKAEALAEREAAVVLGADFDTVSIRKAVTDLLKETERRRELALGGRQLVDAQGLGCICSTIESFE